MSILDQLDFTSVWTQIFVMTSTLMTIFFVVAIRFVFRMKTLKSKLFRKNPQYVEPDLQNRFSKSKVEGDYDFVVIGSGTSGLVSAAILSKLGKKVLVLEQHDRLGGCFHCFTEQGFEFDTGYHYVGNTPEIKGIIKLAGSQPIDWSIITHYDTIQVGEEKFKFEAPRDQFFANLEEKFPKEKERLKKLRNLGKKALKLSTQFGIATQLPSIVKFVYLKYLQFKFSEVYAKSTNEVFQKIGISQNKKLALVLAGNTGDLGGNLDELAFTMYIGLQYHYNSKGSVYPKKGTTEIIKSMASTVIQNGGTMLTKAYVENILVQHGKIVGIQMKGGFQINCSKVISTMGIPNTVKSISPEKFQWNQSKKYEYENAFNCNTLFLGLDTDGLSEDQIPKHNTWFIPNSEKYEKDEDYPTYEQVVQNNLKFQDKDHRSMIISFSTAKQGLKTNKHSVSLLSETRWSNVEKFRVNEVRRTKEYSEYKDSVLKEMKERFLELHPQFEGRISYENLSTPLTYETYYNRKTPYGLQISVEKMFDADFQYNTKTPIKGLYLSGQDICFPGFAGSLMMGVLTAVKSTGYL